jgi:hypothetical protein
MKNICLTSCLLLIALAATAADTKTATSPEGKCAVTVPSTWTTDGLGGVNSPDQKISAIVRSPKHGVTSLADVKQMAPGIYKGDKVRKDSHPDRRLARANRSTAEDSEMGQRQQCADGKAIVKLQRLNWQRQKGSWRKSLLIRPDR